MKKNEQKIYAVFGIILLVVILDSVSAKKLINSQHTQSAQVVSSNQLLVKSLVTKFDQSKTAIDTFKEEAVKRLPSSSTLSPDELAAISKMTLTLHQYTQAGSRLQDLLQFLEGTGQKPSVVSNNTAETGEMATVRTKYPLPGTRYFHAQYFSDSDQKGFVQHMSFELKSGSDSMASAVAAVQNNFPNLPNSKSRSADFVQWDLPDGKILWIKKLAASDLEDNPFNAYTPEDVGTIRVAVELEIHGDQDSHTH